MTRALWLGTTPQSKLSLPRQPEQSGPRLLSRCRMDDVPSIYCGDMVSHLTVSPRMGLTRQRETHKDRFGTLLYSPAMGLTSPRTHTEID
eukprot:11160-Eustigmatos_ZCMA.PRE.1